MDEPADDNCPHCGAVLRGEPMPHPVGAYYSLAIGIEVRGVYDGVLYWQCPSCDGRWHRFPPEHYLRSRAERYVSPDAPTDGRPARQGIHGLRTHPVRVVNQSE